MKACKNLSKCVYGSQVFKGNDQIIKIYKNLYCEAGENKVATCKRYQVLSLAEFCPSYVLPNTMSSTHSIIDKMEQDKKAKLIIA
jgi:hypothetical protein